jgi:hypothetical protein
MDENNYMGMDFNDWLDMLEQDTFDSYLCEVLMELNINLSI